MNNDVIKYIFECILDYASDTLNLPRNEFNDGKRLAYYEILNTIKGQLEIHDIDVREYGFDFMTEDIL